MPMTVNVGYSQKLGRPDYGSIGASCHIECELEGRLALEDPSGFQTKVRELYASCAKAVHEELVQRTSASPSVEQAPAATNGARKTSNGAKPHSSGNSRAGTNGSANHRASDRQAEYLQQLARQIPAFGVRKLEWLAQRICGKPLAELSNFDASSLIDTLKAIKEGRLDVEAVAEGGAG